MRFYCTLAAAFFVAASLFAADAKSIPESTPADGKIDWVYDYQEGMLLSEETDRPMFVVIRCER